MSDARPRAPRLLVTGASGFLGRSVTAAAVEAGCAVRTITRGAAPSASVDGGAIERRRIDLAGPEARAALDEALEGVDCVVHAAAAMTGDDARQNRESVAPTATLIAAMTARRDPPRLVLISSISVYNFTSLPAWSPLDETTPLEPEPGLRDAYCRAKLAQEALARRAAQFDGLDVRALRPGSIMGAGRLRGPRLGFAVGPLLVTPGGGAPVPAIDVADCAAAVLRAAVTPMGPSDVRAAAGDGRFEAINLVGVEQPTQAACVAEIRAAGWPRAMLRVPLPLARAPARAVALAGLLLPDLPRRLPGPLRLESFDARFKPLRYSTARAEDRLGAVAARPLAEAVRAALATSEAA